jgi:hypothetical protein
MTTTKEEKKETKTEEKKQTESKETVKVEDMSPEETQKMMEEMPPPSDYANNAIEEAETKPEEKEAEEEKKEKTPQKGEKPAKEEKPKEEGKRDFFERLEQEMAKPEGKEDLNDFSTREKAYFHQMRRDRKLRQKAEADRDKLLFEKSKQEIKPKEEKTKDPLDGRDEDEYLTVKEARELMQSKIMDDGKKGDSDKRASNEGTPQNLHYLQLCEKECRAKHPEDFDAVMELADELVTTNSDHLQKISERTKMGENPAEVMYELIKEDKEFENLFPAAQVRAEQKAKARADKKAPKEQKKEEQTPTAPKKAEVDTTQAEKKLEENSQQSKTTAHVSSQETKPTDELTLEEIGKMSDLEFAKLPRHVRQRYLKKYGV